jgi:hypothetical protein
MFGAVSLLRFELSGNLKIPDQPLALNTCSSMSETCHKIKTVLLLFLWFF